MTAGYPEPIVAFLGAEPTPEQWAAISMPLVPYVLVAGAGSGKTSVMAARVIYLALVANGGLEADHPGVMPGNVLCLTFTNKATELLLLRIRRALRMLRLDEGEEPEILNYHGFAATVLDRHGMLIGVEPGQRVITPAQRTELAARVLDRRTFQHLTTRWQPSIVGSILALDEQLQNHQVEPEEAKAFAQANLERLQTARSPDPYRAALERIELCDAVRDFRDLKRELGVIDFGDQIAHAARIVREHPEVAGAYRERFQAVLLDEYQDTNHAQAMLMEGIFGRGHPVTAVGDPDQNIYGWRGASLHNLLRFPTQFPRADGTPSAKLPLYTNFRSGRKILAAADRIISPLPPEQRPDPDKQLRPHPPNGEGEVWVAQYEHEVAEAEAIAARIVELHEGGTPWRDVAVLCRTHRLFEPLQLAFEGRDVPAEFIGLAGLIRLPEVVEVLAYARAAADPQASVPLARILMGPRYRVGYGDLARVAAWTRSSGWLLQERLRERLPEDEDLLEDHPFLIAEALEHLDEVEELSPEGRERLEAFGAELAELRGAARRPVGEFLAEIVRRTGLLAELDAHPDRALAEARRRNLSAFLDQVHAFQPLEGELTLRAFLDYVDAIEDDREWAPVQPSEDDTVKVMTVHAAKGLEFDTVFVPGMAKDLFPNTRIQHNPMRRGSSLDIELRRDRDLLPRFDGVMSRFVDALRDQEVFEERRTAYVALTRAKRRLFCSSAVWYGETLLNAKTIGTFLIELIRWAKRSGDARVTIEGDDQADQNPLAGYRQRFVRPWPGPARPRDADALFPEGWRRTALRAAEAGSVPASVLDALTPSERAEYERLATEHRTLATHLRELETMSASTPAAPDTVSVSGLIDYGRCPKRFYWTSVRPLPRFSGAAARIGTDVHAWIERRSSGQASLLELDELPDLVAEELVGEPGKVQQLRDAFLASRFGQMVPLYAERPFLISVEGTYVNGRIDAIFGTPDGPWEVVDYKTGRRPARDDPMASVQLDLYALACVDVWGKPSEQLTLTYLYLASGEEVSRRAGDPSAIRTRVKAWLQGIGAARFDPTPGPHCRWCDFLSFCEPGRSFLANVAGAEG
ncbi:MAG: ATP-dependent helicase [Candidatus Velamenicoccus archaeovorus]